MSQYWLKKKRSLSVHLQPPGKKPLAWFEVMQQSPLTSPKSLYRFSAALLCSLTHCLRLSISFFCLFANSLSVYGAPSVRTVHDWRSRSRTPGFKLSSPRLMLTPRASTAPPLSHSRRENPAWIVCCSVESQPLMGDGGESEGGREGGREENPAEKEWHHLCSQREGEGEGKGERESGWEVVWMKQEQAGGNCIRWIGFWADVDEREREIERMEKTEIERKEREHLYWSAGNIKLSVLRQTPPPLLFVSVPHKLQNKKKRWGSINHKASIRYKDRRWQWVFLQMWTWHNSTSR